MAEDNVTDFASLVARQGRPDVILDGDKDLPSPSLFKSQRERFLGDMKDGNPAIELAVKSFSEVFVLWRPWETCDRCKEAINDPESDVELPEVGDYTCPHNQKAEFKEARDKCLSGEALLSNEEFFNLKNGTRCVHIAWLEPDQEVLRQLKKMEKVREANSNLYPYNPEKAGNKPKEDPPK